MVYQKKCSASQIALYQKCSREYYYSYILKIKAPKTLALVKGSATHKILEEFFTLDPRKCSINVRNYKTEIYTYADSIIEKVMKSPNISFGKEHQSFYNELKELCTDDFQLAVEMVDIKNTIHNYLVLFIMQLDNYIKKYENWPQSYYMSRPRFREYEISLPNFVGYIDAIIEKDGLLIVQDYKTSSLFRTTFDETYVQQLKLYAWGYYKLNGVIPDLGAITYLKFGKEMIIQFDKEKVIDEMEELVDWFFEQTKYKDIKYYSMNTGHQFCTNCKSKNPNGFKSGNICWYSRFCNQELNGLAINYE